MKLRFLSALSISAAVLGTAMLAPPLATDAAARDYRDRSGHHHEERDWRRGHRDWDHEHRDWDRGYRDWHRGPVYYRPPVRYYYRPPIRHHRTSISIYIGSLFGTVLDLTDRRHVYLALETVPSGRVVAWNNPSTGYRYSVTPIRTWQTSNTTYCREFTTTGVIGGRQQQLYGTACRQPDGSWETQ